MINDIVNYKGISVKKELYPIIKKIFIKKIMKDF